MSTRHAVFLGAAVLAAVLPRHGMGRVSYADLSGYALAPAPGVLGDNLPKKHETIFVNKSDRPITADVVALPSGKEVDILSQRRQGYFANIEAVVVSIRDARTQLFTDFSALKITTTSRAQVYFTAPQGWNVDRAGTFDPKQTNPASNAPMPYLAVTMKPAGFSPFSLFEPR